MNLDKTVSLLIDNKRIFADQDATILEAARANGIEIPTLCFHPRLAALGHCRVCVVEVEGFKRPVTSCDNPVRDGMVVTTSSPKLDAMRKEIIELALATHPYKDCLTCVRTGSCELQEKAYHCQVDLPDQLDRRIPENNRSAALDLVRDEEKCILCGRCVQICRTGPGRSVYSMIGRGVNTRIVPWKHGHEVTLEEAGCIFCGQCVDVCPVAALTEQSRPGGGREWALAAKPGICLACSLNCYLERQVDGNRLIRNTVPREGDKIGWLCIKGKFADVSEAADYSTEIRIKGTAVEQGIISYDEALSKTAAVFEAMISDNREHSAIAVMADGAISCEEAYLLNRLAHSVFKTPYLNFGLEPAWVEAYIKAGGIAGYDLPGPTMNELSKAASVLVIGSGLAESHPVAEMVLRQAGRFGDTTLLGIARNGESFQGWQEIDLDSNNAAAAQILRDLQTAIGKSNLTDEDFKSGIDSALLTKAARLMLHPKSYTVVCPSYFYSADSDSIDALLSFASAAGQLTAGDNRLLLLSATCNAAGVLTFGGSEKYGPGFKSLNGNGSASREEIKLALNEGRIKGLLYFGQPGRIDFSGSIFTAALTTCSPENETSYDILFPAPPAAAREGLFINASNQIRLNRTAVESAADLTEGWKLICDLARSLGTRWRYKSLEDVREEMKSLRPGS